MKIGAVIVTFNRIELLKVCLQKYLEQSRMADYLIIVNNASTDGTKEYLDEWEKVNAGITNIEVIHNAANTGGSGGFYTGMKRAVELDVDWVWVSDDDAMPEKDVFKIIENYIENSNEDLSAVCTSVVNNGKFDLDHRERRYKSLIRYKFKGVPEEEYSKDKFELDTYSYVGTMMNTEKLRKVGLVNKDFFLWHDDKEHSWRMSEVGKIICIPSAKMHHDVERIRYTEVSWKTYYGYRNDLLMLKAHASKKYYFFKKIIMLTKGMLDKDRYHIKIVKAAIKAADENNLSLHKIYRPGWKKEA